MKAYTTQEIELAKKIAYSHTYSTRTILSGARFQYDRRTRIGHLANDFCNQLRLTEEKRIEIIDKKKQRYLSKSLQTINITKNPLYLDYKSNTPSSIDNDKISFNGRNHWAKNDTDKKVLQILKRFFYHKSNK